MQESLPQNAPETVLRPFDDRALRALLINAFVRFKLIPRDINHESQIFGAAICAGPLLLMSNGDGEKLPSLQTSLSDASFTASSNLQVDLISTIAEIIGPENVDLNEAIPPDSQGLPSLKSLTASFLRQHTYLSRHANHMPLDLQTLIYSHYTSSLDTNQTFAYYHCLPDRPWESESHAAAFIIHNICYLSGDERLPYILLLATLTTRFDFVKRLETAGVSLNQLPKNIQSRYQEYFALTMKVRANQFDEFDCRALLINAFVHFELVPENVTDPEGDYNVSLYTPPLLLMIDNREKTNNLLDALSEARRLRSQNKQFQLMNEIVKIIGTDKVNLYDVLPADLTSQSPRARSDFFDHTKSLSCLSNSATSLVSRHYNFHYIPQYFNYENTQENEPWMSESQAAACIIHEICQLSSIEERLPLLLLLATLTTRFEYVERLETQGVSLDQLPKKIQLRYQEYLSTSKRIHSNHFDDYSFRALLVNAFVRFKLVPPDVTDDDDMNDISRYTLPMLLMCDDADKVSKLLEIFSDTRAMCNQNRDVELLRLVVDFIGNEKVDVYEVIPIELRNQRPLYLQSHLSRGRYIPLIQGYAFNYEYSNEDKPWKSESHAAACVINEICQLHTLPERLPCLLLLAKLTTRFDLVERLEAEGITLNQLPAKILSRYHEYLALQSHAPKTPSGITL